MKNIYFILIFISFTSCKNDISIEDVKINKPSQSSINSLEITNSYFTDVYYAKFLIQKNLKLNNNFQNKNYKKDDSKPKRLLSEDLKVQFSKEDLIRIRKLVKRTEEREEKERPQTEIEKSKLKNKFLIEEKNGIISYFTLINNSKQNIEFAQITVKITYKFLEKEIYFFYRQFPLQQKQIWENRKSLDVDIPIIFNYANNFSQYGNIFKIHKPESIIVDYFIAASNSVGYKNFSNRNIPIPTFGIFTEKNFTNDDLQTFGKKVVTENITNLSSKQYEF